MSVPGPERRGAPQEPVIRVDLGKPFRPFAGIQSFWPEGINIAIARKTSEPVLRVPIEFAQTRGHVELLADLGTDLTTEHFDTPLGSVGCHVRAEGDSFDVLEMPLTMGITFTVRHDIGLKTLQGTVAEVTLGDSQYYLDWQKTPHYLAHVRRCFGEREDDGEIVSDNFHLYDKDGDAVDVLLPFDLARLSSVEIKFIPKDEVPFDSADFTPQSI